MAHAARHVEVDDVLGFGIGKLRFGSPLAGGEESIDRKQPHAESGGSDSRGKLATGEIGKSVEIHGDSVWRLKSDY